MMNTLGHLHPLLVHLPIGILSIGLLIFWHYQWSQKPPDAILRFIFLAAATTALLSSLTGYVLSTNEDDYGTLVYAHRNAAIVLTITTVLFWWMLKKGWQPKLQLGLSFLMLILLVVTGHQGGSLTHGENFLWGGSSKNAVIIRPLQNIPEALIYADVIAPVLQQKCVDCHGPQKQKGKLRLDTEAFIMKGGKSGKNLISGSAVGAELLKRIVLPPEDEDHMPPKEKEQLTPPQKLLLEWWINNGASFEARVKALPMDDKVKAALQTFHSAKAAAQETADVRHLPEVAEAQPTAVNFLRKNGVIVIPIAQNSHLLQVNFINCTSISDSMLQNLEIIAPQIYWLRAEGPLVTDSLVAKLKNAREMKRLSLAHSGITNVSTTIIDSLPQLLHLNLYGTKLRLKDSL